MVGKISLERRSGHQGAEMMKPRPPAKSGETPVAGGRAGAATVEMAVCLPLLMLIGFGAIETANAIFLKQVVAQVAYEGGRVAALSDATEADILKRCNDFLSMRRIKGASISVSPKNVSAGLAKGTAIHVTVSAPANANAISPTWFFKTSTMSKTVVMVRI
jgi:Flp pilus assembly protein TadG